MAATNQIVEMLRSHFDADEERFCTTALQLAANEARMGHEAAAREIQQLIEKGRRTRFDSQLAPSSVTPGPSRHQLEGLLETVEPRFGLQQMVLSPDMRARLDRVVKEHRHFNRLREYDLQPRQKLLLLGPPGCGKTMTAHALAHELGLPLYIVRLDAIFTKYLGETAVKLRLVFDAIHRQRAVFLFDEFDSLGLARGSQHDVAEIRRVFNSLLVFIDSMRGTSLVIAASNHPDALDPALFRRFDDIIEYSMPTADEALHLMKRRLMDEPLAKVNWSKVQAAVSSMSYAEIVRIADEAVKERIIENLPKITTALILKMAGERRKMPGRTA